ncbi:MAG: ThuA domain-containing protein [Bacteroidales bacterium]|nr:ThuA domain-containing protein [Bacteroidales bacterium]
MNIRSLLVIVLILSLSGLSAQESKPDFETQLNLLVFSKTSGYRHESISSGLKMLYDLSKKQNWVITATEDGSLINDDVLQNIDVVIFLNPTGDALNEQEQSAFEKFAKSKKGVVGIHAAADFEYEWPFYGKIIGAWFRTHPPAQEGTVIFEDHGHPAMKPFKGMKAYTTFDEWYSFKENPRSNVRVLATLDENSIKKASNDQWKMGDHPVIWCQEIEGTRSFYTVFGHTHEAFQDKLIIEHIKHAINWTAMRIK